jgi:DNA-directed RNA polymerase specialized sigma24 family protein
VELSPTKRAQIYTRYLDGRSVPEIVQLEKVKRETVRDIIQRGNKDGRKVSIRSQEGVERKRHRIEMIGRLYEL